MTTDQNESTPEQTPAETPAAPVEQPAAAKPAPAAPAAEPAPSPAAPVAGAPGERHAGTPSATPAQPGVAPRPARPFSGPPRPGGRGGPGGPRRGRGRFYSRRRVCSFCVDHVTHIDYKDLGPLRRYISDRFKIEGRRKTGTCAKHQRALAQAIKRARHLALVPFTSASIADRRGDHRGPA